MRPAHYSLLGKYRDLVLAITLFLFLDMGVLVFNFYTSHLIESDTSRINAAGELRMYSQQLAKAVLTLRHEIGSGQAAQTSLAQVSEADVSFVDALKRLNLSLQDESRDTLGGTAANTQALEQLAALNKTWEPLGREVKALLTIPLETMQDSTLEPVADEVFARNVRIMQQASDLTATLEGSASSRASAMRQIQLWAIAAALLNFVFIVFKFLRSLRQSDRQAEEARNETSRILATVGEGLFLIDRQGQIGSQQSKSLNAMLGQALPSGEQFQQWLQQHVNAEQEKSARDFIGLLFNEKVKPALLKQLNPLREVAFIRKDNEDCYLDFNFEQVRGDQGVDFLLVSVSDVTRKVMLQRELVVAEQRAKTEVEAMLAVLEQDPASVDLFLRGTESKMAQINSELSSVQVESGAYNQLINKIARIVHGIKGEAAAIGLRTIECDIHAFEELLSPLRGRRDLAGEDLIPLAVALNEVHEATAKVWRVIDRVKRYGSERQESPSESRNKLRELLEQISHMTLRVADDLNKKARLHVSAPSSVSLPESALAFLRTTLPQLVRNAVAHGIEDGDERSRKGKPSEGVITCAIDIDDDGTLSISVHDDGTGLSPHRLRQSLVDKGVLSTAAVALLSDEDVVSHIFQPGFSALGKAGIHAGRGEGLNVVREALHDLGGKLRISSRPDAYTRFVMQLEKDSWQCA